MIAVFFVAVLCTVASAELDPRCGWGPTYWCSGLDVAKSCGALDHCKSTVWKNQIMKQDASDSCTFCKTIIEDVKKYIEMGKTKEEISQFLANACGMIPDQSISEKCKAAVGFMISEILDLIKTGIEPEAVCKLMGLCGGMHDTMLHAPISKPLLTPSDKVDPTVAVNAEPICSDCKKFFSDIKDMITSNKTVDDLEHLIDQAVCRLLGPMRGECNSLVHEFLPDLLKQLASYYDPNLICHSLGVCNADKMFYAKNFQQFIRLRQAPVYKASENSVVTCTMCRAVLTQLQTLGRDKSVQDAIKNFLKNNFCSHIGSLKPTCELVVDDYSREFFELLATLLEPSSRCRSLGFCDAVTEAALVNKSPVETLPMLSLTPAKYPASSSFNGGEQPGTNGGPECMLCQFVMKEIVSLIGSNTTQQSIVTALEKVCHLMPSKLVTQCVDFVDTYGPAVIQLIIQECDPHLVCSLLHLCDKAAAPAAGAADVPAQIISPSTGGTGNECTVCVMIIEYLESMLQQNSSIAEIQALLDRVCYHLPQRYIDKCQNLVKKYTDVLVHYISAAANPKEICTLIGVCDKVTTGVRQTVPTVGQNECIWGSSYWCVNRENAEKCNAVDYCKRYIWKSGQ